MKQLTSVLIFLLLLCTGAITSFAQQRTVTGKVTDSNGNPVPSVNVTVKGTTTGTTTNSDGDYSISVPSGNSTLVISSVGFKATEVAVSGRSTVDVSLSGDVKELSNVVVTALGVKRQERSLQYSVTQVDGSTMTQARENSVINSLEGRVAGVNISKIASGVGASTRVVIRGAKTLTSGNNQPLYVIDGIPMDNSNFGQAGVWGGADQGDGMNSINPDDIESITVLKGAAAAALYGARAANGVINITTKKGAASKNLGIELNGNYVLDRINNLLDLQHTHGEGFYSGATLSTRVAKTAQTIQEYWLNGLGNNGWGPKYGGSSVQFDGVTRPYEYAGDNVDRFFEDGYTLTNSVALTGGSETTNMRFSAAELNSKAIVPNSGFDRFNASFAINSQFGKKIKLTGKVLYSNEKVKNRPFISDSPGNAIQSIYRLPGNINVLDLIGDPHKPGAVPSLDQQQAEGISIYDGKIPGEEFQRNGDLWTQNPYWAAFQFINSDIRDRVIPSAQIRYDITDFLYIQGQAGMDWYTRRGTSLTPQGTGYNRNGGMSEGEDRVREVNLEWTLGFDKTFNKIGVNAFVGGNRMRRKYENIDANGNGFNTPFFPAINNSNQRNFGYGVGETGINSLFGSAEISYNNYLFVTGTARQDWFSQLNPDKNGILYPSVGASFIFTDAFALPSFISYGKLRASWGQVGSAASVGPYSTQLAYAASNTHVGYPLGALSSGLSNGSNFPNPDLIPFTSTEQEYGVELRFLNSRLGIDLTYYDQKTTDDILNANISRASGFTSTTVNLGKLSNKGIELLLTGSPVKGNFSWDISFNFAKNKNRVISLIEGQTEVSGEEPRTRTVLVKHIVGYPYGMLTGITQMKDPSGNLVYDSSGTPITDNTYQIIGRGVPDFTGGLTNTFTFKGLSLSFLIDFKSGGDIYSGTNVRLTQQGQTKQTLQGRDGEAPLVITGVTQDGSGFKPFTKTLTPGEAQNYWSQLGSRAQENFIYDASFMKLRQVTLGYTLPKSIFAKTPIRSAMVSLVGRNLAILQKNTPNIDPESSYTSSNSQGLDYFGYPSTRSYGVNVRLTF